MNRTFNGLARYCRACALLLVIISTKGCDGLGTGSELVDDPGAARLITDDLERFWTAYDKATASEHLTAQVRAFQSEYLDRASPGLMTFAAKRIGSAQALRDAVFSRRAYFEAIRPEVNALADGGLDAELRAAFLVFERLYPAAVFADVYLVVGGMSAAGTVSEKRLLIATEFFSLADGVPLGELTPWERSVVRPARMLPGIVTHELVHVQQRFDSHTLLARVLYEGAADFVAELVTGSRFNERLHAIGDSLEVKLWSDFSKEMYGSDISGWLYNGAHPPAKRPPDLGYYVGFKICESYYANAIDKRAAVAELIEMRRPEAVLAASGYADRFQ